MQDSANDIYPTPEELVERASMGDQIAKSTVQARQIVTGPMAAIPDESKTKPKGLRKMSAAVLRLAARMGEDADALVKKYPDDTVRRTKYPVVEEKMPDGKILYKHNPVK